MAECKQFEPKFFYSSCRITCNTPSLSLNNQIEARYKKYQVKRYLGGPIRTSVVYTLLHAQDRKRTSEPQRKVAGFTHLIDHLSSYRHARCGIHDPQCLESRKAQRLPDAGAGLRGLFTRHAPRCCSHVPEQHTHGANSNSFQPIVPWYRRLGPNVAYVGEWQHTQHPHQ